MKMPWTRKRGKALIEMLCADCRSESLMNCSLRFWERPLSRMGGRRGMTGESVCPILEEEEAARALGRQGAAEVTAPLFVKAACLDAGWRSGAQSM